MKKPSFWVVFSLLNNVSKTTYIKILFAMKYVMTETEEARTAPQAKSTIVTISGQSLATARFVRS